MGQSINPEDLFTYTEEVVCVYPMSPDGRAGGTEQVVETKERRNNSGGSGRSSGGCSGFGGVMCLAGMQWFVFFQF